jgi:hypothetical protein
LWPRAMSLPLDIRRGKWQISAALKERKMVGERGFEPPAPASRKQFP